MTKNGIVEDINSGIAKVKILRVSACGENCVECGACDKKSNTVIAKNTLNAKVNDKVIVNMSDKLVLGAAFLVYIIPLIFLIIGYLIGHIISENTGILLGFTFMVIAFLIIIYIDKKFNKRYEAEIIKILE